MKKVLVLYVLLNQIQMQETECEFLHMCDPQLCGRQFVIENYFENWSRLEVYRPWYRLWDYEVRTRKAHEIGPQLVSLKILFK